MNALHALMLAASFSACAWLPAGAADKRPAEINSSPGHAAVRIDGELKESLWRQAHALREISFPWSQRPAPTTVLRAFADAEHLYLAFEVSDDDVVVEGNFSGESTLDREDRVKIFFARDAALTRYFCLEIDPLGRVHDYAARHYRQFDSSWTCAGFRAAGKIRPGGYTVEASVPLKTLGELAAHPVAAGASLRVGIFRAEFRRDSRGDAADNWLSWAKPATEKPDFHVSSAFADWRLPGLAPASAFQTRGVVLVPEDLTLVDWPERAARAGLTTIGLHHSSSPKVVVDFIQSPAVKLPWRRDVLEADAQTYARLGLRHVTTFAVWIDADYLKRFGEPSAIQEYGEALQRQSPTNHAAAPTGATRIGEARAAVVLKNAQTFFTLGDDP